MSELDPNINPEEVAAPIIRPIIISSVVGAAASGVTEAISRVVGSSNPNKLSLDVGLATASIVSGSLLGSRSIYQALQEAKVGNTKKAKFHSLLAGIEVAMGDAIGGGIVGYQYSSSINGALLGTALGLVTSLPETYGLSSSVKRVDVAYQKNLEDKNDKEFVDLALQPIEGYFDVFDVAGWPDVIRDQETVPLHAALNLDAMKKYRDDQLAALSDEEKNKIPNISKHAAFQGRDSVTSLFILPEVVHYHSFDPSNSPELQTQDNDKLALTLQDPLNNRVVVNPLKRDVIKFWHLESEFRDWNNLDKSAWEKAKTEFWKDSVAVLAQFQNKDGVVMDRYWLVAKMPDGEDLFYEDDDFDDPDEEEEILQPETSPTWSPPRLTYNT